jgi:hypothetical protein
MPSRTTRVPYKTLKYYLTDWDLNIWLVTMPTMKDPGDCWFSVRPICDQMGLNATRQRERIKGDHRFAGFWHELPVDTDAGERESLCLRIAKIGLWFTVINSLKVNERFRGKLERLQADIERKAAEDVLGDMAKYLLPPPTPGQSHDRLISEVKGEINAEFFYPCPHCGKPCCMVIDSHGRRVIGVDEIE